jgi:hypothetical protein
MRRFAARSRRCLSSVPPRLGTIAGRPLALLRLGWQIRRLGRATCASCCASAA